MLHVIALQKKEDKKEFLFIAIYILSLIPRLIRTIIDPLLMRDSVLYITLAETWVNTGQYQETIDGGGIVPPLPILITKELILFGFKGEIAARSISLFLGAMIPLLGYYAIKKIYKRNGIAFLCAVVLIIHPTLISYSSQPLRENYYLLFEGLIIIETINILNKRIDYYNLALCGLFSACAFFCRYEGMEILILLPAILLYKKTKTHSKLQKSLGELAVYCLFFFTTSIVLLYFFNFNITFIKKISYIIRSM